jgi:ribosomal protein S18 acetylase RimI-like enzyme
VRGSFSGELVDPFDLLVALLVPWVKVLVAEVEGQVVGTTIVMPSVLWPTAWVSTVGVLPAYRRRGIARALMLAAERMTSRRRLRLEVYADNAGALALYTELGYRQIRHQHSDGFSRRERLELEKTRR